MAWPVRVFSVQYDPNLYMDIAYMPDPVYFSLGIRISNQTAVALYFEVTGQGPPEWTWATFNVGGVGAGGSADFFLGEIAQRPLPAAALTESLTLIITAYFDAAKMQLAGQAQYPITMEWIDSEDGSWTLDYDDNFDDGTTMGWAVRPIQAVTGAWRPEVPYHSEIAVVGAPVLSPAYALRCRGMGRVGVWPGYGGGEVKFYKAYTIPDNSKAFCIVNLRPHLTWGSLTWNHYEIYRDGTLMIYIPNTPPQDEWDRYLVPLPTLAGTYTIEIRDHHYFYWTAEVTLGHETYMDEVKVIHK